MGKRKFFIGAAVAALLVVVVALFIVFGNEDSKEGFSPVYMKELKLFKSLSPNDQAEYLEMPKDVKQAKYGDRLA